MKRAQKRFKTLNFIKKNGNKELIPSQKEEHKHLEENKDNS